MSQQKKARKKMTQALHSSNIPENDGAKTTNTYNTRAAPFFKGDSFEKIMAILMSIITVLITVLALLQSNNGTQADYAKTRGQEYAMRTMGTKASGEVQTGYAWTDAYQHWVEWDTRASIAENAKDTESARRYRAVRDRAIELSPLLEKPYFDPTANQFPNIKAFEAATYIISTSLMTEQFIDAVRLDGEFGDKEDAYSAQQLLLAIALFLYGLSTTVTGKIKWIFVVMGSFIVAGGLAWMVVVFAKTVTPRPLESMQGYAKGTGLAYQDDLKGAITAFDEALRLSPDYANVYYVRGNAHFKSNNIEQAIADYQAARENGREDLNVLWNMGWVYYIDGKPKEAIQTTKKALQIDDNQVALHFNLGLAYLAAGDSETAKTIYDQAISLAAKQVTEAKAAGQEPPASLWWYLGVANTDLDGFLVCLVTKNCQNAPKYETLTVSEPVQNTAREIRRRLKDASMGLEYLQKLPDGNVSASISELKFATAIYDDKGKRTGFTNLKSPDTKMRFGLAQEQQGETVDKNMARVSSNKAKEVFVMFKYKGMVKEQLFTIKLYKDNLESIGLRLVEDWESDANGESTLPLIPGSQFSLVSGEWRAEIYVDAHLVQEGGFIMP